MEKKRNPPARKPEGIPSDTTTTDHHHEVDGRFHHTSIPGHRRWRKALQRMTPLHCGCRDLCYCTTPPMSDNQLDGWADCARYVMDTTGCTPLLPIEVLRALYRRGGDDRALAETLHAAANGVFA
jgi:hypothetical protein